MNTPELPQTDSIQELAKFGDMHDVTELEDELEEVSERVFHREAEECLPLLMRIFVRSINPCCQLPEES